MSDPFTVSGSSESQDFQPLEGGVHRGQLASAPVAPARSRRATRCGDHRRATEIIAVFVTPDVLDSQGEPRQVRKFLNLPRQPHARESRPAPVRSSSPIGKKLSDAADRQAAAEEVPEPSAPRWSRRSPHRPATASTRS